ncbi:MAG: YraN family protein [Victivallaceae bacterium]
MSQSSGNYKKALRFRQRLGRRGENLAVKLLKYKGMEILTRNLRLKYGEIDIIALDGECLVFVEVKSRRANSVYRPLSGWSLRQRRNLKLCARYYLRAADLNGKPIACRFDMVELELSRWSVQFVKHHINVRI